MFEACAHHCRESPSPNQRVCMWTQIRGEDPGEQIRVLFPAICGLRDDVAHVSITSPSAVKLPGRSRSASAYLSGASEVGSTRRALSSGTMGSA
jgi:hypothetical protein